MALYVLALAVLLQSLIPPPSFFMGPLWILLYAAVPFLAYACVALLDPRPFLSELARSRRWIIAGLFVLGVELIFEAVLHLLKTSLGESAAHGTFKWLLSAVNIGAKLCLLYGLVHGIRVERPAAIARSERQGTPGARGSGA